MNNEFKDYLHGVPAATTALVTETAERIVDELHHFVVGRNDLIEMLITCLLAEGNLLITGDPGIAKTTTAKLFSRTLGCTFNRQQFTPDILPSDVTGSYVFDQRTNDFYLRKGGIFSNVVMIDEINRAPPRTQAALLESMEEKSVTIEGTTIALETPFMVIATQSSIPFEGTYPLPTVQLDRFAAQMTLEFPNDAEELAIVNLKSGSEGEVRQVTDVNAVRRMIEIVKQIHIEEKVIEYIRDIVVATRRHKSLSKGVSPRASISLMALSRARAALEGRGYVVPDDVKHVAHAVLTHRPVLAPAAETAGVTIKGVIDDILVEVPIPQIDDTAVDERIAQQA